MTTMKTSFTSGPAIFFCLDAGYLDNLAFIFAVVNISNISTYFRGFPDFSRPSWSDGIDDKDTNRVAYIGTAGIKSTCIRDICTRGTNVKDTSSARGTYVKGAFVRGICAKIIYIGDANTVEHLEMHLQFF